MNYRTQDVIVWDRLPHPDSQQTTRPATWSVRITPPFWQRVAAQARVPARRAAWERWLTPDAVSTLCDADDRRPASASSAHGRGRSVASSPAEALAVPVAAIHRLQETLAASLERPNVLRIDGPDATRYHVVLVNGASLILRAVAGKPGLVEGEDCFFSRAARDYVESAGGIGASNPRRIGRARWGATEPLRSVPGDAVNRSALYMSASPFASAGESFDEAGAASTAGGSGAAFEAFAPDSPACRRAVVRQLVQRYAVADEPAGGLVPPGDEAAGRSRNSLSSRVRFLAPAAWGFAGPEQGRRWTGCDDDCNAAEGAADVATDLSALRLAFEGDARRAGTASASDAVARWGNVDVYSSDRYPATDKPAGNSGNLTHFPRPANAASPARPASPPAACPFLDPLGCLKDLNDALRRLDVRALGGDATTANDERTRTAAYRATAALGKCRVFGATAMGLTDAALAPAVAIAAAAELEKRMRRLTGEAESLATQLARAGAAAGEDACLGLLESRTEAWAAYVAIDEAYAAAIDAGDDSSDTLADALDRLFGAAEALDAALQAAEPRWSIPAAARLRSNWLMLLSETYRETPPWWLAPACLPVAAAPAARVSVS